MSQLARFEADISGVVKAQTDVSASEAAFESGRRRLHSLRSSTAAKIFEQLDTCNEGYLFEGAIVDFAEASARLGGMSPTVASQHAEALASLVLPRPPQDGQEPVMARVVGTDGRELVVTNPGHRDDNDILYTLEKLEDPKTGKIAYEFGASTTTEEGFAPKIFHSNRDAIRSSGAGAPDWLCTNETAVPVDFGATSFFADQVPGTKGSYDYGANIWIGSAAEEKLRKTWYIDLASAPIEAMAVWDLLKRARSDVNEGSIDFSLTGWNDAPVKEVKGAIAQYAAELSGRSTERTAKQNTAHWGIPVLAHHMVCEAAELEVNDVQEAVTFGLLQEGFLDETLLAAINVHARSRRAGLDAVLNEAFMRRADDVRSSIGKDLSRLEVYPRTMLRIAKDHPETFATAMKHAPGDVRLHEAVGPERHSAQRAIANYAKRLPGWQDVSGRRLDI